MSAIFPSMIAVASVTHTVGRVSKNHDGVLELVEEECDSAEIEHNVYKSPSVQFHSL